MAVEKTAIHDPVLTLQGDTKESTKRDTEVIVVRGTTAMTGTRKVRGEINRKA